MPRRTTKWSRQFRLKPISRNGIASGLHEAAGVAIVAPAMDKIESDKSSSLISFRMRFEEAWEGWIKSVLSIALIIGIYALYKSGKGGEYVLGTSLVVIVIASAAVWAFWPAWQLIKGRTKTLRILFFVLLGTWILGVSLPTLELTLPLPAVAETQLTANKLQSTVELPAAGNYRVVVSGHFKQEGAQDVSASYSLALNGQGGKRDLSGNLLRSIVQNRTSRRGGTSASLQEHNEVVHRLQGLPAGTVQISTDGIDEQLAQGLTVTVFRAGPNPIFSWVLLALAVVLAVYFDSKIVGNRGKEKLHLAVAVGVTAVFAISYPGDATPHFLVKPAVGNLVLGLVVGGGIGWTLGFLGRGLFGPRSAK